MSVLNKIYKNRGNFESENTSLKYGFESENVKGKKKKSKSKRKKKIDFKRIGAAVVSGGASELAKASAKKLKQLKKSGKLAKVKGKLRGAAKKAFLYAKYSALTPMFAPVLPFKPAMVLMLKKRGVKTNLAEPIAMVSEKFYKNVLKNQPHFDLDSYEENIEFLDNPENFTGDSNHFYDQLVKIGIAIVKGIVDFFKKKKADKDSGKEMDSDEKAAVVMAEKTTELTEGTTPQEKAAMLKEPESAEQIKTAIDKADKSGTQDTEKSGESDSEGKKKGNKKMLLIIGAAVLVLFFVMKE